MSDEQTLKAISWSLHIASALLIVWWTGIGSESPNWKPWSMFLAISLISTVAGGLRGYLDGWIAVAAKSKQV